MPLTVTVPGRELFNDETGEFLYTKDTVLTLEHSLVSISKWESKWHKSFFSRKEKSFEEAIDYFRCMTISNGVDDNVFYTIARSPKILEKIDSYVKDPMTATVINKSRVKGRSSSEMITSELIYYWMTELNIPFDPCQKWHINRLMTLIEVCKIKSQPGKKMSKNEIFKSNSELNRARRAKHGTKG